MICQAGSTGQGPCVAGFTHGYEIVFVPKISHGYSCYFHHSILIGTIIFCGLAIGIHVYGIEPAAWIFFFEAEKSVQVGYTVIVHDQLVKVFFAQQMSEYDLFLFFSGSLDGHVAGTIHMHAIHVYAKSAECVQEHIAVIEVTACREHDHSIASGYVLLELPDHAGYGPGLGKKFSGIPECTKVKALAGI